MSTVERAACALAKAQSGTDDWDGLDNDLQRQLKAEALAVIEAIREPSEAMASAGAELLGEQRGHSVDASDLRDAWVVMVDALNKGVSG